jgi:hypothetical protein
MVLVLPSGGKGRMAQLEYLGMWRTDRSGRSGKSAGSLAGSVEQLNAGHR